MIEKDGFTITFKEKKLLLEIARESISDYLSGNIMRHYDESELTQGVTQCAGAFVSLHKNNKLRGCIGRLISDEALYRLIQKMAVSSAFRDYRFKPVQVDEMEKIDIEISVLSPLRKIDSINEFIPGKHGIYIKKDERTGTFLPQVGLNTNWSKEEMLGHCARDKAGLGWDEWKDAELFIYSAAVFGEKDMSG